MRFPAGGALWRTQSYYDWSVRRNGGMLQSLKVGLSEGSSERLNRSYAYNSFGDLTALTEDTTSYAFTYDGLGRLTAAYGRTYSYDGANRLTAFNGQQLGYSDVGPYHAVDRIGNADRFDYDANGNMTKRNKGLTDQQTLVWNAENRLSEVQDNNGNLIESYWYDIGGSRVKKTSGNTTSYTFFGHYEEEVSSGSTTAIHHYSFGSLRIAVKRGGTLYHLHGDHLGSTSLTTAGSAVEASRAYYAYGAERSASGDLKTDRTFTAQKSDASGLLYYNARYYDPTLGTFISPDSLVPNPARVVDYNRFLYARGNPLKYSDPSGHASAESIREWKAKNSWYNARGWAWGGSHWNIKTKASFASIDAVIDVLKGAGIEVIEQGWKQWELELLLEGIEAFGKRIEKIPNHRQVNGFAHLKGLIDGTVEWHRMAKGSSGFCAIKAPAACAWNKGMEFYDALFNGTDHDYIRGMAVHEMAHKIHFDLPSNCGVVAEPRCDIRDQAEEFLKKKYALTAYAAGPTWWVDYWAEAVGVWVFRNDYPGLLVDAKTEPYMIEVFDWVEGIVGP